MKNLLYASRYATPNGFAQGFVDLHHQEWNAAEDHWERAVRAVLDTDAVGKTATGDTAVAQAVSATAVFLTTGRYFPWCPWCRRGIPAAEEVIG